MQKDCSVASQLPQSYDHSQSAHFAGKMATCSCSDARRLSQANRASMSACNKSPRFASKKPVSKLPLRRAFHPRYHSNCAFAPLRDSIKSVALTRHHGIPYFLVRRNRQKFQVISSEGMGPLTSPLPVHTTHRLSESLNIGLSSSSLLRFILLNCPHCSAFSPRCQHFFYFFLR